MSNLVYTENKSGLGVTIHHVNLAAGLSPHHTLQIRQLLNRHRLVAFPGQELTDEDLANFAFRFGPPFIPDNHSPVLGSDSANVPTAKNSVPSPMEYVNMLSAPKVASREACQAFQSPVNFT